MIKTWSDLTPERLKTVIIGVLMIALGTMYTDHRSEIRTMLADHKNEIQQKDLEIKMINAHHVEYVEQKERQLSNIEIKVDQIKETKKAAN